MSAHFVRRLAALALLAGLPPTASAGTPVAAKHVILIMMENRGTDAIFGNKSSAPYINTLITRKGVRFATQYYGVTHPSLPNYLALISGDTQGIFDDCRADPAVTCKPEVFVASASGAVGGNMLTDEQRTRAGQVRHLFAGKTLVDQLDEARVSWKVYMQGMPADQKLVENAPLDARGKVIADVYAQKHNPFVYFANFRNNAARLANLVPYEAFVADVKGNTLPGFSWISPDQCHDMHGISAEGALAIGLPDCSDEHSADQRLIRLGDDWLMETVEMIRAAPAWQDDTVILIVWDEDDFSGNAGTKGSPIGRNGVMLGGGRVPFIAVTSKDDAPRKIDSPFNHYNLLATIQKAYGVGCLGRTCEVGDALIEGVFDERSGGQAPPAPRRRQSRAGK